MFPNLRAYAATMSSDTVESITRVFSETERQLRRLARQLELPQLQIPG